MMPPLVAPDTGPSRASRFSTSAPPAEPIPSVSVREFTPAVPARWVAPSAVVAVDAAQAPPPVRLGAPCAQVSGNGAAGPAIPARPMWQPQPPPPCEAAAAATATAAAAATAAAISTALKTANARGVVAKKPMAAALGGAASLQLWAGHRGWFSHRGGQRPMDALRRAGSGVTKGSGKSGDVIFPLDRSGWPSPIHVFDRRGSQKGPPDRCGGATNRSPRATPFQKGPRQR